MTKHTSRYNWKPDLPDVRDHLYCVVMRPATPPPSVNLSVRFPPPFDQGQLGSCTGNALGGQMAFLYQSVPNFSRLFIYRGERAIEHTISQDAGAMIRDGVKFLANAGCCPESDWPYTISKFKAKPPVKAFTNALPYKISQYVRLQTLGDMIDCLATGFPFVFGFTVYDSFESAAVAKTGIVNMPARGEKVVGGHAVEAVGYDMATKRFLVRNSWGASWGLGGYFTIPFDYLANRGLSDDFWTIRK
jgi:C1A family cysteine protease